MRRAVLALIVAAVLAVAVWYPISRSHALLRHPVRAWRLIRADSPAHLLIPVRGVRPSQLRDTWGAARSGGRVHRGIDIFAPRGREIESATDGIVATVGRNQLGGRIVRILGPGGDWHYYAHLERFGPIREGDFIRRGTVLGFVGDSGNAKGTPPHLHYGIYRFRGGAVNPYPLLR